MQAEYFSVQDKEEESGSESPVESGEEGGDQNEETGEDNKEKNNNQGEKFAKKSAMNLEEDLTSDEEVLHVVNYYYYYYYEQKLQMCKICVVVNFLSQVIFIFLLFLGMLMYANGVSTKEK